MRSGKVNASFSTQRARSLDLCVPVWGFVFVTQLCPRTDLVRAGATCPVSGRGQWLLGRAGLPLSEHTGPSARRRLGGPPAPSVGAALGIALLAPCTARAPLPPRTAWEAGLRPRSSGGPVSGWCATSAPGAPPSAELAVVAGGSLELLCHRIPPESLVSAPATPEPSH